MTTKFLLVYSVSRKQIEGMAFAQDGGCGGSQSDGGSQSCWHCGKTGHTWKKCPELQQQQLKIGVDNLNIKDCDDAHALFSTEAGCRKEECTLVQRNAKGVQAILPLDHLYIVTCASYSSTPSPEILSNIKTKHQGLIGHSNFGSSTMSVCVCVEATWFQGVVCCKACDSDC
jgi:hypothetical protein